MYFLPQWWCQSGQVESGLRCPMEHRKPQRNSGNLRRKPARARWTDRQEEVRQTDRHTDRFLLTEWGNMTQYKNGSWPCYQGNFQALSTTAPVGKRGWRRCCRGRWGHYHGQQGVCAGTERSWAKHLNEVPEKNDHWAQIGARCALSHGCSRASPITHRNIKETVEKSLRWRWNYENTNTTDSPATGWVSPGTEWMDKPGQQSPPARKQHKEIEAKMFKSDILSSLQADIGLILREEIKNVLTGDFNHLMRAELVINTMAVQAEQTRPASRM